MKILYAVAEDNAAPFHDSVNLINLFSPVVILEILLT
jgi:hypothetical protein